MIRILQRVLWKESRYTLQFGERLTARTHRRLLTLPFSMKQRPAQVRNLHMVIQLPYVFILGVL